MDSTHSTYFNLGVKGMSPSLVQICQPLFCAGNPLLSWRNDGNVGWVSSVLVPSSGLTGLCIWRSQ